MKYLVGTILLAITFAFAFSACGNDGGVSSVLTLKTTNFTDLNIYAGSKDGAVKTEIEVKENQDKDSLYRTLVRDKYLRSFRDEIDAANKVSFEFLENGMMMFHDKSDGNYKMISEYVYDGNDLYILKEGTEKVYVATREADESGFYREKAVMRRRYDGKAPTLEDAVSYDRKKINLKEALEFAGFESEKNMVNPKDSIIWCNVKYIYNH